MRSKGFRASDNSIRRLSKYLRELKEMEKRGIEKVSSYVLGERLGHTPSQIRQDLSSFGDFGYQGYGYNVSSLRRSLEDILGKNSELTAILVGAGNIGKALLENFPFDECGVRLLGAYDVDPAVIGTEFRGIAVQSQADLDEELTLKVPDIAILCVPKTAAVETAEHLVERGIRAIWNYTNTEILPPYSPVILENVHFTDSLQTLCHYVAEAKK